MALPSRVLPLLLLPFQTLAVRALPADAEYVLFFWEQATVRSDALLTRAVFSDKGDLLLKERFPGKFTGEGPLSVSASPSRLLFAGFQEGGDEGVFTADLAADGTFASTPRLFRLSAAASAEMTKPCAPACTEVNIMQAAWAGGDELVFLYSMLDATRTPQWAPAIGVATADGSAARPLSFNATMQDPFWVRDSCPQALGNGSVAFVRTTDGGGHSKVWTAPRRGGGAAAELPGLPVAAHKAGCPTALADGTLLYLACRGDDFGCAQRVPRRARNASAPAAAARTGEWFEYGAVATDAADPSAATYSTLFPVPLVDQPSWFGNYARTQCRATGAALRLTMTCLAAPSYTNDDVVVFDVDPATGLGRVNASLTIHAYGPRDYEVVGTAALAR